MTDDIHYKLLKLLQERPNISQRKLSKALGVSLGKANDCIKALLERGWVKMENFRNSRNKLAYAYLLTPQGLERKATIAVRFLKRKTAELEALEQEIERLRAEVAQLPAAQRTTSPDHDS
ncbi:MarR family EPS-associated transcriptional regulator [Thiorhodococcus minor]|uniref:MarR family EPS-associated transcriptional regulator n=1 Tax=Thiorhodococcus minor TaxID=57489 RepID=A0A6M0K780_9GAMM|nr:MarR family EPS-associated transcriptional regulator [Thiorhodococcus minor]NEV64215.1 MarR family EPS-associated transcriptional regulator [Thiorhodococcus minor]